MADMEHSLAAYVSDMLALEEHIRVPLGSQRNDRDFSRYPEASALLERMYGLCDSHISALESTLQTLGGHEMSGVKSAVTNIEGWFASAIDMVRKTKVAKSLRDDYTALGLCCIGYEMLLTTANGYGNTLVAQLAERHLHDYASAVMAIGDAMPAIVIQDLRETGVDAAATAIQNSRNAIHQAWRSQTEPPTTTGTIESDAQRNRASSPTYPTI